MTGIFLQLSRVFPDPYPLSGSVRYYLRAEHGFGRHTSSRSRACSILSMTEP